MEKKDYLISQGNAPDKIAFSENVNITSTLILIINPTWNRDLEELTFETDGEEGEQEEILCKK